MATEEFKRISAEDFAKLNFGEYTLLDLREPDELIVSGIEGAVNVPFSQIGSRLSDVPKDKPVIVYCRVGDWSEEVAEILADRGYDVTNLEGGYKAYRALTEKKEEPKVAEEKVVNLDEAKEKEPVFVDAKGLQCPGPIVKVADTLRELEPGDRVYVEATEDAFASDIKVWTERTGNILVEEIVEPKFIRATIEKAEEKKPELTEGGNPIWEPREHEKTMVVFSGDLDKTIAAFIMANGAAALGRPVTIFFTFWGLNVLRKPERVKVNKNFVEKAFGFMMPRGTKKLGLSRMNFGGAGALMIRWIMKKNNIDSLEKLIDDAIAHGVRLVACQMSMGIMGIHEEELIDGIEYGGVATMLGSAEKSDLTYFI